MTAEARLLDPPRPDSISVKVITNRGELGDSESIREQAAVWRSSTIAACLNAWATPKAFASRRRAREVRRLFQIESPASPFRLRYGGESGSR
jgi:hypothetical protein